MSTDEQLMQAIREAQHEQGRVTCSALLALAEEHAVSPKRLGELCDAMPVKITHCQLGCFE